MRQDRRVLPEIRVRQVHRALLARLDHKGPQAHRVRPVYKDPRGRLASRGRLVERVQHRRAPRA